MNKKDILAVCVDEIRNGRSTIEDCVARHPEFGGELRSLLQIASRIGLETVAPSPEFVQRAERQLLVEIRPPAGVKGSHGLWPRTSRRPSLALSRVLISVLAGLLVLGAAGGSTVYAAKSSLPGDALYPVKTSVENFQLALTPDAAGKANLHLQMAQRRVDEAIKQVELGRGLNDQALGTIQQQFDDAIGESHRPDKADSTEGFLSRLSSVTLNLQLELEQTLARAPEASQPALKKALTTTRRGNMIAQVAYTNREYLERRPSVTDEALDKGQFKIDGTLLGINGRTWNLGGVTIDNIHYPSQTPPIGSRVKVEGFADGNEVFISRVEVSESSREPTRMEGQFSRLNENGTADIGGISVEVHGNSGADLKAGDNVALQGDDENRLVTDKQGDHGDSRDGTMLRGTLTAVKNGNGAITVKTAGSQITVDISAARIENEDGKTVVPSDLRHMLGFDVKVSGLEKRGDLLSARQVRVETHER